MVCYRPLALQLHKGLLTPSSSVIRWSNCREDVILRCQNFIEYIDTLFLFQNYSTLLSDRRLVVDSVLILTNAP
uniref:Uncharacterized protein n=1 Tax=Arundo donax TaxID=35708 RepID=A0A0A9CXD7_ARUDO